MKKVNCSICKKELKVYPYRLKTTKDFYCKDHIKDAWDKYRLLGRKSGPAMISKLAKEGKLPKGMLKGLEKGRGWMKNKYHTEESKKKMSESLKKRVFTPEVWQKMMQGLEHGRFKGRRHSDETKKKISELQKGREPRGEKELEKLRKGREKHLLLCKQKSYWTEERRKKASDGQKKRYENGGKHPVGFRGKHTEESLAKMRGKIPWNKELKIQTNTSRTHFEEGFVMSKEIRKKISNASKKNWEKEEYRKKVLGKRGMSGLETRVNKIIQKYNLPYKFVGDGKFHIERKIPDFININGEKKAIEVYWDRHKEQFAKGGIEGWKKERVKIFKKYGWEIIFIEGTALTEQKVLNLMQKGGE